MLAVVAGAYGTYLLVTVGEELDTRGRASIYTLAAALSLAVVALLAWLRGR